jgi:hypothetical protein
MCKKAAVPWLGMHPEDFLEGLGKIRKSLARVLVSDKRFEPRIS